MQSAGQLRTAKLRAARLKHRGMGMTLYTCAHGQARTHQRRAVNGSLEVDSLEYVPRLAVAWPTDSWTLSGSPSDLAALHLWKSCRVLLCRASRSTPFHPHFPASLLSRAASRTLLAGRCCRSHVNSEKVCACQISLVTSRSREARREIGGRSDVVALINRPLSTYGDISFFSDPANTRANYSLALQRLSTATSLRLAPRGVQGSASFAAMKLM